MLVLVGLLQPLLPLFDQIICTRSLEITMQGPKLPLSLGNVYIWSHHQKHIGTHEGHVGLGWIVAASASII
jgi:hypothetical protein